MLKKHLKKGFSLVELLVVITIIAILSVAAYTAFGGQTVKAKDARRSQDLSTIQSALELYVVQNNRYPESLTNGLEGAPNYLIPKKYLSTIPKDPSGKEYVYLVSGDKKSYEIAAVLESDGLLANFSSYIVGNSDIELVETAGGQGKYFDGSNLQACGDGKLLARGTIGDADAAGSCIAYDPR
ncbi:type II secretion system GspH family protein [Patescibacteria group bacterium]|nr:type II secretion system GspH family protein [Patescibacteria group bacterium]